MSEVRVDTQIDIAAARTTVWEVLTDLASYSEWNPMITGASGTVRVGERLTLHFEPEGQRPRVFRPKLLNATPERELRWLGSPRFPGVLDSEHYFILTDNGEGGTHLDHGTVFFGLIVPLMSRWIENSTRVPFQNMNTALKQRAENNP